MLITGGTGALGPRVVEAFLQRGCEVRVLARQSAPPGTFSRPIATITADVLEQSRLEEAMQGIDAVIHLAALLHIVDPWSDLSRDYEAINIGGTAAVISAALKTDVKRLVFFSTIAVYGPGRGRIITEETPVGPDSPYGMTKLAAEKLVLEAVRPDFRRLGCVLRVAAAYGPRVKGNYRRLVQALARGHFVPLGSGTNRRTLIYDKDVGQAAVLASSTDRAAGRVYNVSDGEFHTLHRIIQSICDALGRKPPRLSIPITPVKMAASVLESAFRMVHKRAPITSALIDKYLEDIAVDSSRIQNELGFKPAYKLDAGWRETVAEMRQAGEL